MRRDNMLSSRFGPGFRIRLHLKNLMNALDRAKKTGVILPTTAEVERLMQVARVAGREDFDHSGLITVTDDLSHFRVADFAGGADGESRAPRWRNRNDPGQRRWSGREDRPRDLPARGAAARVRLLPRPAGRGELDVVVAQAGSLADAPRARVGRGRPVDAAAAPRRRDELGGGLDWARLRRAEGLAHPPRRGRPAARGRDPSTGPPSSARLE